MAIYCQEVTTQLNFDSPSTVLNGEQACFLTGACLTFAQATVRNNTSEAYHLQLVGLPWSDTEGYKIEVLRVADNVNQQIYLSREGHGNVIGRCRLKYLFGAEQTLTVLDITLPFPANAQDLVSVEKVASGGF